AVPLPPAAASVAEAQGRHGRRRLGKEGAAVSVAAAVAGRGREELPLHLVVVRPGSDPVPPPALVVGGGEPDHYPRADRVLGPDEHV
ncbi:hypothetical protein THAOC_32070, partial [Thalassiosira oceanica]